MPELVLIPFGGEDTAWPALRPYFDRIAAKLPDSTVTADTILARAHKRELMLWKIQQGWCLTGALATGEMGKTAFVEAIAGDRMRDWLGPCLADLEDRCRAAGMQRLRAQGRKGWLRLLRQYGFTPINDDTTEKRL